MPLGAVGPFWARHLHIVRAQPQARIVTSEAAALSANTTYMYLQLSPMGKAKETTNLLLCDDTPPSGCERG